MISFVREVYSQSHTHFMHIQLHAIRNGAAATRVETVMRLKFGTGLVHYQSIDEMLASVTLNGESSKKRQAS